MAKKAPQRVKGLRVIDEHLAKLNLTRRWLAAKLDISEQALAGWWIRNKIPLDRVIETADIIGIDPGDIEPELAAAFRRGWTRQPAPLRAPGKP